MHPKIRSIETYPISTAQPKKQIPIEKHLPVNPRNDWQDYKTNKNKNYTQNLPKQAKNQSSNDKKLEEMQNPRRRQLKI